MKRIYFFATPSDVVPLLERFESGDPLKFIELGDLTTPNRAIYLQSSEIPNPGIATHESAHASDSYLVSIRDTKNHMEKFVGSKGEVRWALNNSDNEESVVLTLAGLWEDGTLLPGKMDTLHRTVVAQQLMKRFQMALKKEKFTSINGWWVGNGAMEMLLSGKRLTTTAVQSPPEYDLRPPVEALKM